MRSSISNSSNQDEIMERPYQIYSEMINAGKTVAGSKRRIKWRFGWSNGSQVQEVDLVHSLVSGKRTISENGIEVVSSSQSLMAADFSHGWNSLSSRNHVFRVEATISISSDPLYVFIIDGVQFTDLPREASKGSSEPRKSISSERRQSAASESQTPPKAGPSVQVERKSVTSTARSDFQSPAVGSWNADPFGGDPFGTDAFAPSPAQPAKPASAASSLFASFDDNSGFAGDSSGFEAFGSTATAPPATAASFDPFASSSAPNDTFDPFVSGTSKPTFSPPTSKPLTARPSPKETAPAPVRAPVPAPAPAIDLLNTDAAPARNPSRRMSAQDILLNDLSGLSFAPAPPTPAFTATFEEAASEVAHEAPQAPQPERDVLDEATSRLVSFNLTDKKPPMATPADRKLDHDKRLSLNDLMTGSVVAAPERRPSMISRPADPFALPPQPPASFQPSVGYASSGPAMGAYPGAGQMNGGGFGGPSAMGASNPFGSSSSTGFGGPMGGGPMGGGPMGGGPMGGGPMGGGPMGGGPMGGSTNPPNVRRSSINVSTMGQPSTGLYSAAPAPKSSLDTLDWKM